jgi:glutamyl-tRNA reductase
MYNIRLTHKEIEIEKIPEAGRKLREFVQANPINDYVFLQTCNRAELYFNGASVTPPNEFIVEDGEGAFKHLLRIACGLESFVVGETEILSQLKDAYQTAKREGHCSNKLGRYFEAAIKVGKKVRRVTRISEGKVSVVSLALDYIHGLLGNFDGKKVLIIGAGEIGTKVAKALKDKKVEKILVANRGYERAIKLAREIGANAYKLSHLDTLLQGVDIVICATSAPHYILTKERIKAIKQKLVVVDLSVPRNVDESVKEFENVELVTFKDLAHKAGENLRMRMDEVRKVEKIIEQEIKKGEDDLRELYKHAEEIRQREVEKALRLLTSRPPEEVIEDLSKVLVKKLYHPLRESSKKVRMMAPRGY